MRFKLNRDFVIDTDVHPWKTEGLRICLFGGPGSGKSNTAAVIIEQFLTQGGPVVIFQPRDEYWTLKEKFDVICVGGVHSKDIDFLPSTPSAYAKAVVENGVSLIFYTSDVEDEEKLVQFTHRFIRYILKYQETTHRPILLVLEEAHEYAPLSAKGHIASPWVYNRMIKAFKDVFTQGRKLNVSAIAITQRPQELNFSIRQLANLSFYGKFSPQDISYIDRACLKYYKNIPYTAQDLRNLPTGKFVTITSETSFLTKVTTPRLTKHGAETPTLKYIKPHKEQTKQAIGQLTSIITQALEKAKREETEIAKLKRDLAILRDSMQAKDEEIQRLKQTAETLGKIKVESATLNTRVNPEIITELKQEHQRKILNIRNKILDIFEKEGISHVTPASPKAEEIYKTWAPKLPHAAKRILRLLAVDKHGLHMTKREIAVALGYKYSGTFNSAIAILKRNHLIKTDGRTYWVD